MSDREKDLEEMKSRVVLCPHCSQPIRFDLGVRLVSVSKPDDEALCASSNRSKLSESQQSVLKFLDQQGILSSFEAVVRFVRHEQTPTDIGAFFFEFMKTARPIKVPPVVLETLIAEFPNERIEVWSSQGIAVIVTRGLMRCFIAQKVVQGIRIKGSRLRTSVDTTMINDWIRTKFGFVAGPGPFLEEIRKRCLGEFARPMAS